MSKTNEEDTSQNENIDDRILKLGRTGRVLVYSTITTVWAVAVGLGIRDLWIGKGIIETPWIIFGLVLSLVVVFVIVVPLFKSLKADVQKYKDEKEKLSD